MSNYLLTLQSPLGFDSDFSRPSKGMVALAVAKSRVGWNLLCAAVTIVAVAVVVRQITWKDSLRVHGEVLWGWETRVDNQRLFLADAGTTYPLDAAGATTPGEKSAPQISAPQLSAPLLVPGFLTLLKRLNGSLLALAFFLFPGTIALMAFRWQILLRTEGLDPGFLESLRLTWLGMLANNVLPGSTGGDLAKAVCICRRTPSKKVAAVLTVFMDRVIGLIALMMVGASALLTQSGRPELAAPARFVWWMLLILFVGGVVFFSRRIRRLLRVADILARLPLGDKIQKLDDAVFRYRDHLGSLGLGVAISLLMHLWTIGCVYLLGLALGMSIAPIYYYIFLPVIFTGGAVAPSVNGLGVLEGGFQFFFSGVGATPASAVALCIIYRLMVLVGSIPGAIPFFQEIGTGNVKSLVVEGHEEELPTSSRDPLTGFKAAC